MAHYAFLDDNNVVTQVIVGKDENELIEGKTPEIWYGEFMNQTCLRTSRNTYGNRHTQNGISFRKNYACIGFTWDGTGFAAPQPFPSWTLNSDSYLWEAPTPMPDDGKNYLWDESTLSWIIPQP